MCEVALNAKNGVLTINYDMLGNLEIVISQIRAIRIGGHEQFTVRIASDYLI